MERLRRKPARIARIADMGQGRVAVVGTIVNKDADRLILDDGSGQATVLLMQSIPFTAGNIVRIIGRAYLHTIEAEEVTDMSDLDVKHYTKMLELKKKAEEKLSAPG